MKALPAMLAMLMLAACERGVHDMYDQPRYRPGSTSPLFANGSAARPPQEGTVAHSAGAWAQTSSGRRGMLAALQRPAITLSLLQRGRARYDIDCAPCHGLAGDGDGIVVQRGFPAPPSYHDDRLVHAPDAHLYDVISDGYGVMYPYRDRVAPADRWAIMAYVRALQASRRVPADRLDARDRSALDRAESSP